MPDWSVLEPHRPLLVDDPRYVEPPGAGGAELAARVRAGARTVLVGGAAGIGKSTVMAQAATILKAEASLLPCFLAVDTLENVRRLTADRLLRLVAAALVVHGSARLGLKFSADLLAAARQAVGASPGQHQSALEGLVSRFGSLLQLGETGLSEGSGGYQASGRALLEATLAEVKRSSSRNIVLLLDGTERLQEGADTS